MSNTATPLNKDHSIQEVIFSLELQQKIDEDSVKKLIELKEILQKELPSVEILKAITFQFNPSQLTTNIPANAPAGVPVGIICRHINKDNIADWTIRAEQNMIIVNCLEYKGWEKTWPKARTYLETLTEQVIDTNAIKAINLQYTNIFKSPAKQTKYDFNEVFCDKSQYVTDNIKKSGSQWHLFQGWLEDDAILKCRCLNNLNLAASVINKEHITNVALLRQAQLENLSLDNLDRIMNQLHTDIKKTLFKVLAPSMAKRIGLEE